MTTENRAALTCILCPRGCALTVTRGDGGFTVEGSGCRLGSDYAIKERTNPERTVTTTVKTSIPDHPRLAVRTSGEIPLARIFAVMREVNRVVVSHRAGPGEVILRDVLGLGIDVISTDDMRRYDHEKEDTP
ncbi:DUF1667 domain-containing protein [Myxococcota bacterium]|nr:DUF1667 domain-containing protein [Myxococcota bacterium]MBU1536685.1 DUF1667 domain-containing protein [Myxococcota bacterium]